MRVCSLFAGAGGIDLAFEQAGFTTVWANEFDKDACKTFRRNFPGIPLVEKDIRKVKADSIPDFDVLVGGFPCQPFSIVGRQEGFNDDRGNLFFDICRIVDAKSPSVIFLENVANLVQHDNGNTFKVIKSQIEKRHYTLRYIVANACDYGFPQVRNRIYMVCFKDGDIAGRFQFPAKSALQLRTWDIIDRTKTVDAQWYLDPTSDRYKEIAPAITDERLIYRLSDMGILSGKNGVVFTLMAGMGNWPNREPMIKDVKGIRRLTPHECFLLQGFPASFDLTGIPEKSAYRQAGNSVCVPVVRQIAENIKAALVAAQRKMERADTESADTLVGSLRNSQQLDVCLSMNFYHVPKAQLSADITKLRFVAIYQSNRFFGGNAGIRYIGRITEIKELPRKEIAEIPKNSDELYYKFIVNGWKKLDNAIKPARTTMIYVCNHSKLRKGDD